MAAPEPRYVAPTLRDRIGRVWAPVYINGQGPLRLVLDTGASASAVTVGTAAFPVYWWRDNLKAAPISSPRP